MDGRRDLALELLAVLACGAAAGALFWVVTWSALATLVASAAVVAVAGLVAWHSQRPYLVLSVGILSGAAVAVSQGYAIQRVFAGFCIFEPCAPAETRLASLVDALPLSLAAVILGAVAVALIARAKGLVATPRRDV
ncbi:MAG: hypothetical protein AABY18_07065 [Candidatus Thermoplasmatota archaeon]